MRSSILSASSVLSVFAQRCAVWKSAIPLPAFALPFIEYFVFCNPMTLRALDAYAGEVQAELLRGCLPIAAKSTNGLFPHINPGELFVYVRQRTPYHVRLPRPARGELSAVSGDELPRLSHRSHHRYFEKKCDSNFEQKSSSGW